MSSISLNLTTQLSPPKKFTVDGTEYQLLGIDHLSPDDEAEATALFARFGFLAAQLEQTPNVVKGKDVASRMRDTRVQLICKLTDMPKAVAAALPLSGQARLMDAINEVFEAADEDEAAQDSAPGDDDTA